MDSLSSGTVAEAVPFAGNGAAVHADASHAVHAASSGCTNCGAEAVEVYCARCGERQPDHHDLTIGHFAHEVTHELIHLDSKLFGTLGNLVARPGFLTAEYFNGRKKRYIAPLRLFLTLFALYFVAYTAYKPVTVYSIQSIERFDRQGAGGLTPVVERLAAKRGMSADLFRERVDITWRKYVSYSQLANILALALVLKALYRRRYTVEHLVFSAHYLSFTYLLALAVWPIYYLIGFRPSAAQSTLSSITTIGLIIYSILAFRRFYDTRGAKLLVKGALFYGGTFVATIAMIAGSLGLALFNTR